MHIEGQRIWANVLVNVFFFLTISLGATFYLAKKYVSEASYAIVYKRVYEAITGYLPIGAALLFVFLILGKLQIHHIYQWMNPEIYEKGTEHYDKVIAGKEPYFNSLFFWGRMVVFFSLYILAQRTLRK